MGRESRKRNQAIIVVAAGLLLILLARSGAGQAAPGEAPPLIPAPQQTVQIAVTPQGWDNIGAILTAMGYDWTLIPLADLADYSVLSQYDVVFINCSWEVVSGPATSAAFRQFVQDGGSLYASDWAFQYIKDAFAGHVNFRDFPYVGDAQTVLATITDPSLATFLDPANPPTTVSLTYDLSSWVAIDSVSAGTTVHLRGSFQINGGTGSMTDKPLVVSFLPYGFSGGRVVFTTFHQEANQTPQQQKILEYLVLILATGQLQQEGDQALRDASCYPVGFFLGTVDAGAVESAGYYVSQSGKKLCVVLTFAGSTLRLSLYDPSTNLYGEQESSTPPVSIVVPSADAGDWQYQVTGVDVPYADYPYVVGIGQTAYHTYLPVILKNH